jgi:hypothetical protein
MLINNIFQAMLKEIRIINYQYPDRHLTHSAVATALENKMVGATLGKSIASLTTTNYDPS